MKGARIDNRRDKGVEIGNGATIANSGALTAEYLGLALDALAGGALGGEGAIQWAGAVKGSTLDAARLPIEILDQDWRRGTAAMPHSEQRHRKQTRHHKRRWQQARKRGSWPRARQAC